MPTNITKMCSLTSRGVNVLFLIIHQNFSVPFNKPPKVNKSEGSTLKRVECNKNNAFSATKHCLISISFLTKIIVEKSSLTL